MVVYAFGQKVNQDHVKISWESIPTSMDPNSNISEVEKIDFVTTDLPAEIISCQVFPTKSESIENPVSVNSTRPDDLVQRPEMPALNQETSEMAFSQTTTHQKDLYSYRDSDPFLVILTAKEGLISHLYPLKLGKLLFDDQVPNIHVVKPAWKSKFEIHFKTYLDPNKFLMSDFHCKYRCNTFIPSYQIHVKGIIKNVAVDVIEDEIKQYSQCSEKYQIKLVIRFNKKIHNDKREIEWHPPTMLRMDCPEKGGGMLVLISPKISLDSYRKIMNYNYKLQAIEITLEKQGLIIIFVYNAPQNYNTDLFWTSHFPHDPTKQYIICGDFNLGFLPSYLNTNPGRFPFLASIYKNEMSIINSTCPTRLGSCHQQNSALDLTMVSRKLIPRTNWRTHTDTLGSDHFPIIFTINVQEEYVICPNGSTQKKNVDWTRAAVDLQEKLLDSASLENFHRTIYHYLEEKYPSTEKRKQALKIKPLWWNSNIQKEIALRRHYLNTFWRQPSLVTFIAKQYAKVRRLIVKYKRSVWRAYTTQINAHSSATDIWKAIKWFTGYKVRHSSPISLTTDLQYAFLKLVAPDDTAKGYSYPNNGISSELLHPIKNQEISKIITAHRSKSVPGPDSITYTSLAAFPNPVLQHLAQLFTSLLCHPRIPASWHDFYVIPIQNPNTVGDLATHYRPIALGNVLRKVFEKILASRISFHLERYGLRPQNQYGFRKGYNTTWNVMTIMKEEDVTSRLHQSNINMVIKELGLEVNPKKSQHSIFASVKPRMDECQYIKIVEHTLPALLEYSRSALQAIIDTTVHISQSMALVHCKQVILELQTSNNDIQLVWILSHSGIPGNEYVDQLAKSAAKVMPKINEPLTLQDYRIQYVQIDQVVYLVDCFRLNTEHDIMGKHLNCLHILPSASCILCHQQEDMDRQHLAKCPALKSSKEVDRYWEARARMFFVYIRENILFGGHHEVVVYLFPIHCRYNIIWNDRTTIGGGILCAIQNTLVIKEWDDIRLPPSLKGIRIQVSQFTIVGIYSSGPAHSYREWEQILEPRTTNMIICGDFNIPHFDDGRDWHLHRNPLIQVSNRHKWRLANHHLPTRMGTHRQQDTSPDLILISDNLYPDVLTTRHLDTMGSDHYHFSLHVNMTPLDTTNIVKYRRCGEPKKDVEKFVQAKMQQHTGEFTYQDIEEIAVEYNNVFHPLTQINSRPNKKPPWWNATCSKSIAEQRLALSWFCIQCTYENFLTARKVEAQTRRTLKKVKRASWKKYCLSITQNTTSQQVWKKIAWNKNSNKTQFLPPAYGNISLQHQFLQNLTQDSVNLAPPIG
ncbi:hypothetical protein ANN_28051 [Periplaneta americana]|uniref:Endonuclease/exonuclease/phosphatase domain-containing protein n=1 Tax=Periplaneta americana TaxID=6978 RepID=A0ABQ8RUV5_PERAM|nr:hypothetical protein ANN_28051 [Periplaneta americana]